MWPILFTVGRFELRTISIFLVLAFLAAAFMFWRKGKEEHYSEFELMDAYLLSFLVGSFAARIGFIAANWSTFGLDVFRWIDVINFPGVSVTVGVVTAGLYLYRLANHYKWDAFEILDFWSLAMSLSLSIWAVGLFLDGSAYGRPTDLPWGMIFPGLVEKHHPTQLYTMVFFIALFVYLARIEYRYRTFNWYRGNKNTAQTGFLISVFILAAASFYLLLGLVFPGQWYIVGINLDPLLAIGGVLLGAGLLFQRSGRSLWRR